MKNYDKYLRKNSEEIAHKPVRDYEGTPEREEEGSSRVTTHKSVSHNWEKDENARGASIVLNREPGGWPVRVVSWIGHALKPAQTGVTRTDRAKTGDSTVSSNRSGSVFDYEKKKPVDCQKKKTSQNQRGRRDERNCSTFFKLIRSNVVLHWI